ncbi:RHS repeat domain-containing protein [uncultured Winogradskyella sp.]|uniref:RHS repeat protein n=1 Tax=uncultured Winogradskyella sp. TaxID=395353 RepID=UPI0030D94FB6|tara:strand:- start:760 stop:4236 length:3477 start_codon:yes stop_codon:yes gene_type:complete
MKNHFFIFLIVLMFTNITSIAAQDLPNIEPPSPEAASLGKFTEVPISHYTGLPNISIPITSYDVGGKSFSVGISYHARGIRVEEIASRVGIGWALNAGGQISRQIRDKADEGLGGYIGRSNILMDALAHDNPSQNFFSSQTVRNNYASASAVLPGGSVAPDRHPDQFNVQVGDISAKFVFNYKDDKPLIQSYQDLQIEGSPNSTFIVTDKSGFKYYFGGTDANNWDDIVGNYVYSEKNGVTIPVDPNSIYEKKINTWLLTKIESPNGKIATFHYDSQVSNFFRRSYDKIEDASSGNENLEGAPSGNSKDRVNYSTKIESNQYQLTEIRFGMSVQNPNNYNKIVFESTDSRQDLQNANELNTVTIYDQNNIKIKSFELYHSYFNSTTNNTLAYFANAEPQASKRLKLDSIVEHGKNGSHKPPHIFMYNNETIPHRFSNSQDFWGYYNGANNGNYLMFFDGMNGPTDRTVDTLKSMAGMLEGIKYPTGGRTKFIYEHNKGILGPEYNHINMPLVNPVVYRDTVITHFDAASYSNGKYTKDFTINQMSGPVKFTVDLPAIGFTNNNFSCAYPTQSECGFNIDLIGINGNSYSYYHIYAGEEELYVEPGDYRLVVDPVDPNWNTNPQNSPFHFFSVSVSWNEQPISEDDILFASGKRIKKVEFYDSGNNLVSFKEYDYKNDSDDESGVILSLPSFAALNPMFSNGNYNVFQPFTAIPGNSFTTYQGNTIGYESVTEYYGDKNNNFGKSTYEFSVHKDSGDFLSYPITPPTDNEWLRGLAKNIKHFKQNSDGSYQVVKEIINDYSYGDQYSVFPLVFTPPSKRQDMDLDWLPSNDHTFSGLPYEKLNRSFRLPLITVYHPYLSTGGLDLNNPFYKINHYTGGTLAIVKNTEKLYDDNENITLVTQTETEFNYDKHYQPDKVISVTSDGKPLIQTFIYPQNTFSYDNALPNTPNRIEQLAYQNRVVPIEVKSYKDWNNNSVFEASEQISFTRTIYDLFGNVLEPSTIQTGKGVQPNMQNRIEFKEYDSDGNILQVSKADGMDITYIYGYNNTLPVAKIENATYTQVSSYVNNIKNKSNIDDDRCLDSSSCDEKNMRIALQSLRSNLPNAMVTTYTYDPLIGVTSITDSKGYTVYYEYDNLHRLVRVKDEDGKIMSENKYHYLLD